jgi:hypothetical protein
MSHERPPPYRDPNAPACPGCSGKLDCHDDLKGSAPKPGDITICLHCGEVLTFTVTGGLRFATLAECNAAPPEFELYVRAVALVRASHGQK